MQGAWLTTGLGLGGLGVSAAAMTFLTPTLLQLLAQPALTQGLLSQVGAISGAGGTALVVVAAVVAVLSIAAIAMGSVGIHKGRHAAKRNVFGGPVLPKQTDASDLSAKKQ